LSLPVVVMLAPALVPLVTAALGPLVVLFAAPAMLADARARARAALLAARALRPRWNWMVVFMVFCLVAEFLFSRVLSGFCSLRLIQDSLKLCDCDCENFPGRASACQLGGHFWGAV